MTDLSERAIALIMWERTLARVSQYNEKALSAERYYNSTLKLFDFDYESLPVVQSFRMAERATAQARGWHVWKSMCDQYLAARGWEPLP